MKLVIVESPSKAQTIEKYLGAEYNVRSSIGHIRDLPKTNKDAINIDAGFIPRYEISPGKNKVINELAHLAEKADEVLLAPDPDREGEAIAWHLKEVLSEKLGAKLPPLKRVTFNEITKEAVTEAIKKPRAIDEHLKQAQEARRVLDRLVGYDLSGLVWKKVRYGLSAGRVQSPALRILMEREREIRAFNPEAYYVIEGQFKSQKYSFPLTCSIEPTHIDQALSIVEAAEKGSWSVIDIKESIGSRNPKPPFTTSTLQQTASSRLGFSPTRTMRAAQKLYEAGHITYMRTDSQTLSETALTSIKKYISEKYGSSMVNIVRYKTSSKNAQEAHEAIRPTQFNGNIQGITSDERALYELILVRTLASQMKPAEIVRTKLIANITEFSIPDFVTNGSRIIEPGWLLCDPRARGEDVELPHVTKGDSLELLEIHNQEKFTTPPNRYSEAGLIKELEKRGIGRPSTYASIIKTIIDRAYVLREGRILYPTDTGDVVSSFLENNFAYYIGDDFTAEMENHLDSIATGEEDYTKILKDFYTPFSQDIASKEHIPKVTNLGDAPSEYTCPLCSGSMMYKLGRTGKFMSCSRYPDCEGVLTIEGKEIGGQEALGIHPETKLPIYVLEGRFGPYVQIGETPKIPKVSTFPKGHKKTLEEKEQVKKEKEARLAAQSLPSPRRASIPPHIKKEEITLDQALHLLMLPRELGIHPESKEMVIANVGRFGPYVGHGREFRSIKKTSGLDPYTITLDQSLALFDEPKSLPKGVILFRKLGKDPKSGKEVLLLQSKSGFYIQKGLKRIYLSEKQNPETVSLEEVLTLLK